MRRLFPIIFATLFVLPIFGRAEGVQFFKGTVYEALNEATRSKRMLMLEFYAQWSYKSRWMRDNVLSKSDIGDSFVVVSVDTQSEQGAALAVQYEVTDYPVIVIFSSSGTPIDKIDKTLSLDDFLNRLETAKLAADGRSVRQLTQIFTLAAVESPDKEQINSLVATYLAGHDAQLIASPSHWDLFVSPVITYYGSEAYRFLTSNLSLFASQNEASSLAEQIVSDAIMPYVAGSVVFDSVFIAKIEQDSVAKSLLPMGADLCQLARYRHQNEAAQFVILLSQIIDGIDERYEYQLIMSLDFVAQNVAAIDKMVKGSARRLVEKLREKSLSPSKIGLIEALLAKFS